MENSLVFILGGGPSLSETNLDLIRDKAVIGCNAAFLDYPWVPALFFGDCRFYTWYREEMDAFTGKKYHACSQQANHPNMIYYEKVETTDFTWKQGKVGWPCNRGGANTGATAINLAVHLGYKTIVLLGFDMKKTNGRHNYHNYHQHTPSDSIYYKFHRQFKAVADELRETNISVFNATPQSHLTVFPKASLKDFV